MNTDGKFRPLREQAKILQEILYSSPAYKILRKLSQLEKETGLKFYLAGGAVFQTVWDCQDKGCSQSNNIADYDIVYFDDDTSYEAEDAVIERVKELLPGEPVDVKNQARVHLWFHEKFGNRIRPYTSIGNAVRRYGSSVQAVAVRIDPENGYNLEIIAPFGLDDIFTRTMRRNPDTDIPLRCFNAKAVEFKKKWPGITIR